MKKPNLWELCDTAAVTRLGLNKPLLRPEATEGAAGDGGRPVGRGQPVERSRCAAQGCGSEAASVTHGDRGTVGERSRLPVLETEDRVSTCA